MTNKEKYKEFVNIVCEMLGFNKPIDILKLCQKTSDFIKPYEMKIKDLEQVNEQLEIYNNENITEAKDIIRNLLRVTYGGGWNYSLDWKVKAEQFLKDLEND